jgi:pantoate--beta-alanine ligase
MQIAPTIAELRESLGEARHAGKSIGLVPTMGALHEGHLSLVRLAKKQCDLVVVSVFVNPTQFGPTEDLSKYPRTFERDQEMLTSENVEIIFAPSTEEMYPPGASTYVEVEGLSERLDGKSRPGHFRGVATIVSKLFNIVQPDKAFFGQKDAAQVAVIRKMVRDLDLSIAVMVGEILRETDGLAMSSRNVYLSPDERKQALVLSQALQQAKDEYSRGERTAQTLRNTMRAVFTVQPSAEVDYIEVVDWQTLLPVEKAAPGTLLAVAAKIGSTRLIDNIVLPAAQ